MHNLTNIEIQKIINETSVEEIGRFYYIVKSKDPDYPLRFYYLVMCTGDYVSPNLKNLLASVSDDNECYIIYCLEKGVYKIIA